MAKVEWDAIGDRRFEAGLDKGVLYVGTMDGVPWNGLVSLSEDADGGEVVSYHFDGRKYNDSVNNEDFKATLSAFTYPDEFSACEGYGYIGAGFLATSQVHETFDLTWRTKIGNDVDGIDYGYKIHLLWNATATPSAKAHSTIASDVTASPFAWEIKAVPPYYNTYFKPTAHLIVDSRDVLPENLEILEGILYGTEDTDPHMPSQAAVVQLLGDEYVEVTEGYVLDGGTSTVKPADIVSAGTASSEAEDIFDGGDAEDDQFEGGGGGWVDPTNPTNPGTGGNTGGGTPGTGGTAGGDIDGGTPASNIT